jgi:hypothetical protein
VAPNNRRIAVVEDLRIALEEGRAGKGIPHKQAMRRIDTAIKRFKRHRRVTKAKRRIT